MQSLHVCQVENRKETGCPSCLLGGFVTNHNDGGSIPLPIRLAASVLSRVMRAEDICDKMFSSEDF